MEAHLKKARHHRVGQDDRLELALLGIAVLPRQHVHLALVHAQLANVGLRMPAGILFLKNEWLTVVDLSSTQASLLIPGFHEGGFHLHEGLMAQNLPQTKAVTDSSWWLARIKMLDAKVW